MTSRLRSVTGLRAVYVAVVGGIWLIIGTGGELILYGFLTLAGAAALRFAPADWWARAPRRHAAALLASLLLSGAVLLSLRAPAAGTGRTGIAMLPVALVLAFFETALIYGATLWILNRFFRPLPAIALTALLYTCYHLGFYGPAGRVDQFALSFGTYMVVGMANGALVQAMRSPLVLFPAYLGFATLFDLSRSGITIATSPPAFWVMLASGLVLGAAVLLMRLHQASEPFVIPTAPAARSTPVRDVFWPAGGRTRLLRTLMLVLPCFVLGLFFRFIINDPVPTEGPTWVLGTGLFLPERTFMARVGLNLGLAGFLIIPYTVLMLFYDAPQQDRRAGMAPLAALRTRLSWVAGLTGALGFLLVLPAAAGSLLAGEVPTAGDFGRFLAISISMALYAVMVTALVLVVARYAASPAWSAAITLVMYMVIYNYWMVYPLFSQYWELAQTGAAGRDPSVLMGLVWQQAGSLYAWIPHYAYYTATAVALMRSPLASELFLPSLGLLATYAAGASALAAVSSSGEAGA